MVRLISQMPALWYRAREMGPDSNVLNRAAHAQTHSTGGFAYATAGLYARNKSGWMSRFPCHDVRVSGPWVEVRIVHERSYGCCVASIRSSPLKIFDCNASGGE
jgi:hypothetical protein